MNLAITEQTIRNIKQEFRWVNCLILKIKLHKLGIFITVQKN